MESLERQLNILLEQGRELSEEEIPGYEQIDPRMQQVMDRWNGLKELADHRRNRLLGATDYYQVQRVNTL